MVLNTVQPKAATAVRCGACGGRLSPAVRACPSCGAPGPRVRWPRRAERLGYALIALPVVLVALGFGLGMLGAWMGNDLGLIAGYLGMGLAILGAILFLPALAIAVVLGIVVRRVKGDIRPLAAWSVTTAHGTYAVVLPRFRTLPPKHVWVDGARCSVDWQEDGGRSRARLAAPSFDGVVRVWAPMLDAAISLGTAALTATGADVRFDASLEVAGAVVVAVEDGSHVL